MSFQLLQENMGNPTTYEFAYENIADDTQIDNFVKEMDLNTEYKP